MFNIYRHTQSYKEEEKLLYRGTHISIFLILNCVLIEQQVVILSRLPPYVFQLTTRANVDVFRRVSCGGERKNNSRTENFIYQSFLSVAEVEERSTAEGSKVASLRVCNFGTEKKFMLEISHESVQKIISACWKWVGADFWWGSNCITKASILLENIWAVESSFKLQFVFIELWVERWDWLEKKLSRSFWAFKIIWASKSCLSCQYQFELSRFIWTFKICSSFHIIPGISYAELLLVEKLYLRNQSYSL